MIFNVHAGHNPDGKKACGAIGLIKESTEARKVKDEIIRLLKLEGHTVYDCTCENGLSQSNVLTKIVNKCNSHTVDLDVSIHFNAGTNDKSGNGLTTGTEVLIYNSSSKAMDEADRICKKISALGFRNRGIKTRNDLYVLRKTKSPALLVECCFVDDADDIAKYDYRSMAKAIVEGILNKNISNTTTITPSAPTATGNASFKVKVIDNALNIRSGAGTNYKIVGCIRDKGIYTITKTSGSWGYLKSGAGWISISTKYVKYV